MLTPEAQQGIFRYTATDNSVRTINLLDLARSNGLPGTIDPYIASQLQIINGTLSQGDLAASTTLYQNTFRFINEQIARHQRLSDRAGRLPGGVVSGDARRR